VRSPGPMPLARRRALGAGPGGVGSSADRQVRVATMGILLAPVLFFLVGFLSGYLASRALWLWITRLIFGVVLWTPIAALLLLQYTEVIDPDTLRLIAALLPRVIELPVLGFLVGYWVCPVSTDGLPLSYSASSHSSFLVL